MSFTNEHPIILLFYGNILFTQTHHDSRNDQTIMFFCTRYLTAAENNNGNNIRATDVAAVQQYGNCTMSSSQYSKNLKQKTVPEWRRRSWMMTQISVLSVQYFVSDCTKRSTGDELREMVTVTNPVIVATPCCMRNRVMKTQRKSCSGNDIC